MVARFIGLETCQPPENQEAEASNFSVYHENHQNKPENPGSEVCTIKKESQDSATLCHEILHVSSAADHLASLHTTGYRGLRQNSLRSTNCSADRAVP